MLNSRLPQCISCAIARTSHGEFLFSSIYFNNNEVDLDEAGEAAAALEYSDPTMGLARGIFVWDAPLQPGETETTTRRRSRSSTRTTSNEPAARVTSTGDSCCYSNCASTSS